MAPFPSLSSYFTRWLPNWELVRNGLYWRTFFLLLLLLACSQFIWLQTFRTISELAEPEQNLERMVTLVERIRNIKSQTKSGSPAMQAELRRLEQTEHVHIQPRRSTDRVHLPEPSVLGTQVLSYLRNSLGETTFIAQEVNDHAGLWLGFDDAGGVPSWVHIEIMLGPLSHQYIYLFWGLMTVSLSMTGAWVTARLINRPITQLTRATARVEAGDFQGSRLDESVPTKEVRAVNQGFNRMAHQLARVEHNRAIMLAGISHDLRTPISRLRLDIEMSVSNAQNRNQMVADLEQMNAIIDKFMDYARSPDKIDLRPVSLLDCLQNCFARTQNHEHLEIAHELTSAHLVMADTVELERVLGNLMENALRYGRSADDRAYIGITITRQADEWLIEWRDFGKGVPPALLERLTEPFFRANLARTAASGAGLGLTITDMIIRRMGGQMELSNATEGGLVTTIRLKSA